MHINHQFLELCKKDAHLDLATDDMTDVEPIMVELLELIEHNLDNRPMFAYFFKYTFNGSIESPDYLIPFCMRKLQWNEIKEHIF